MSPTDEIVFASEEMKQIVHRATRLARDDGTIWLEGPSGSGRKHLARWIHAHSARRDGPLVRVDLSDLGGLLGARQLLGQSRWGAAPSLGAIRSAEGGTLLLENVDRAEPDVRSLLAHLLTHREVLPVAASRPIAVNVRVMACSTGDLHEMVHRGHFPAPLLCLLSEGHLTLPPLVDRPDDIPPLLEHFLGRYARELDRPLVRLPQPALDWVMAGDWAGNVAELAEWVRRLYTDPPPGERVAETDLPDPLAPQLNS